MKFFLLIDDDPISNYLISLIFKSISPEPALTMVTNGEEAIEYLNEFNSANQLVILLDIHMPGIDGYDFLEHLKENDKLKDKNLEIIVISSSITSKDIEKFEFFGIKNYLAKPINKSSLEPFL